MHIPLNIFDTIIFNLSRYLNEIGKICGIKFRKEVKTFYKNYLLDVSDRWGSTYAKLQFCLVPPWYVIYY